MKRPSYLERGRRTLFGRPVRKPIGPVAPPPDPAAVADFDLGTWRVRPGLARMTRADRIVALDAATLLIVLVLAEQPAGGVNRDELAARVFGPGGLEAHEAKLRRCLSFLRRAFSEDGAVHLENVPGDAYALRVGAPVPERGLRPGDSSVLFEDPGGVGAWLRRGRHRLLGLALAAVIVTALGVTALWLVDRGNTSIRGRVTALSVLAAEPGENTGPSFSPDGRQLVYAHRAAAGLGAQLWLRATAGGAPRALTQGPGSDRDPAWSPAGTLIAFERESLDGCAVEVIAPDGSGARAVGDCGLGAAGPLAWTPDGAALLFAHRTATVLPTQLVSLNLADGRLTGVSNPVIGMPGDSRPALASTGRRLLFVRTRAIGVADLMLLDLGAEVHALTHDGVPPLGAAWEPGGWMLVYASSRGGRAALWRARADGLPPALLLSGALELRSPALSNDARHLAFEAWRLSTRVVALPLGGAAPSATPWPDAAGSVRGAALAPNGRRAALIAAGADGHEQLLLAAADGSEARVLASPPAEFLDSLRWSPDGRYVSCTVVNAGRSDIWIVAVDASTQQALTSDGGSRAASFSRDGRWVYFSSDRSGRAQLWRQPWPAAGPAEQLTTEGGSAALEARSGEVLYYVRPDRSGLWQRGTEPGGDDTLVTPELAAADWPNWDVGPRDIWFALRSRPDGPADLARYSLDSGRVMRVRPLPALLPASGFALDPAGTTLLYTDIVSAQSEIRIATIE